MITETPPVEEALGRLRERGVEIRLAELVVLGAHTKLAELDRGAESSRARAQLRQRFLERTMSGSGLDLDAALAVRERGWTH